MKKSILRVIALILMFSMFAPIVSAVAAEEPFVQPTIEEILNNYHEKAFAAQNDPSNNARSGSGSNQTLEQETVAELTAAGYEAYNVTGENYETLEETLHTDFGEMCLDPDGSYIVVISGEDPASPSNPNACIIHPPFPEDFDDGSHVGDGGGSGGGGSGGGGSSDGGSSDGGSDGDCESSHFTYVHNGVEYTMRYLTITSADNVKYFKADAKTLISASDTSDEINNILNSSITLMLDAFSEGVLGTISSLCNMEFVNIHLSYPASLTVAASAEWTRVHTQVYHESADTWLSYSSVDYVNVTQHYVGFYYDKDTRESVEIDQKYSNQYYSEHYSDENWRKQKAARGYYLGSHYNEYVGNVIIESPASLLGDDYSYGLGVLFRFYQYKD